MERPGSLLGRFALGGVARVGEKMIDFGVAMKAAQSWHDVSMAYGRMMLSANEVIQRRMLQMAMGQMKPEEAVRMVMEKPAAFAKSFEMATRAAAASKGGPEAILAAIRPIEAKTRANSRRLRRG